jgi:hypothetical protein
VKKKVVQNKFEKVKKKCNAGSEKKKGKKIEEKRREESEILRGKKKEKEKWGKRKED